MPPPSPRPVDLLSLGMGPDGRIAGLNGIMDQIAAAVVRQLRVQLLPSIVNDKELQRTVGEAAGIALADRLWPFAAVAAAALAAIAVAQVVSVASRD